MNTNIATVNAKRSKTQKKTHAYGDLPNTYSRKFL